MTFDVNEWLSQDIDGQPLHERLCFLIYANDGLTVTRWGCLSFSKGGHQSGLEQSDALNLIYWGGFIDGFEATGVSFRDAFEPYWTAYCEKWGGDE